MSAGVDLPSLGEHARLRAVLASASRAGPARVPRGGAAWGAAFYGLDRVGRFTLASASARAAVLERAGRGLLAEIWYIEKLGVAFAARMALLARTTEERALYGLFAADEAQHLLAFAPWVPDPGPPNAFVQRLGRLIEEGDRATLACVVQVVLEGWGLSWYRRLREACEDPALAEVFDGVLLDEARHFAAGVVVCTGGAAPDAGEPPFPGASLGPIVEVLADLFGMVSAGPVSVVEALEAGTGPLSDAERARAYAELDAPAHVRERMELLTGLLARVPSDAILRGLVAAGALPGAA